MHKSLQHGDQTVPVVSQHAHDTVTRGPVVAFDTAHLHGIYQHTRESERDCFWKLFSVHGHLKTVPEVDVQNLSGISVEHEIGRMAISETKNIAYH